MAQYTPDVIYIASIYPGKLDPIRRNYGPTRESLGRGAKRSTLFELQPVPRGKKPFVLAVYDSFEETLDVIGQGGVGDRGSKPRNVKAVPVETIVNDILSVWTGGLFNVPAGAKPGIMQIAGTVPTQAELQQMKTQQAMYLEYWYLQGEAVYRGDRLALQKYTDITPLMRLAADYLGYSRPWSDPEIARDSAPCPHCQTMIQNAATVCYQCGRDVVRPKGRITTAEVDAEQEATA